MALKGQHFHPLSLWWSRRMWNKYKNP